MAKLICQVNVRVVFVCFYNVVFESLVSKLSVPLNDSYTKEALMIPTLPCLHRIEQSYL